MARRPVPRNGKPWFPFPPHERARREQGGAGDRHCIAPVACLVVGVLSAGTRPTTQQLSSVVNAASPRHPYKHQPHAPLLPPNGPHGQENKSRPVSMSLTHDSVLRRGSAGGRPHDDHSMHSSLPRLMPGSKLKAVTGTSDLPKLHARLRDDGSGCCAVAAKRRQGRRRRRALCSQGPRRLDLFA